jgi:hypothetical protein
MEPNSRFTFTGIPSPSEHQASGTQTGRAPPSHPQDTTDPQFGLTSAIQNMTNHQSRFTSSLERLINSTADKFNDDGRKKIGGIISEVIKNASTSDGTNPAGDLTPFAKDILSLPGDQPLTMVRILFQKVRAVPTPKFIKAI